MVEQVAQAMEDADFSRARVVNGKLKTAEAVDSQQLYGLLTEIRLDAYEHQRHGLHQELRAIELLRARMADMPGWPRHWYIQAWYTAPLVSGRRVDPHYLFYLCQKLHHVEERQECLLRAAQYALQFEEDHFMVRLKSLVPFGGDWLASQYHRAMFDALLAAYDRDAARLRGEIERLNDAADSPLRRYEVGQFAERYGSLADEAEA